MNEKELENELNKKLEKYLNDMTKRVGKENMDIFISSALGMMSSMGFKPANIQILQNEIHDLIQENLMKKYALELNCDESKLDKIEDFLKNIKEQTVDFINELNDDGEII